MIQRSRKDGLKVRVLDSLKFLELALNVGDFLATWSPHKLHIRSKTDMRDYHKGSCNADGRRVLDELQGQGFPNPSGGHNQDLHDRSYQHLLWNL